MRDNARRATLGIALAVLLGSASLARYSVGLVTVALDAEIVVVADELSVAEVDGWSVATVKVTKVLRGNAGGELRFLAEPTWACDTSRAEPGTQVFLFLAAPSAEKDPLSGSRSIPEAVDGAPIYRVAHYGRGRLPIQGADGREVALYEPGDGEGKQAWPVEEVVALVARTEHASRPRK